jgi:hypothetical protein
MSWPRTDRAGNLVPMLSDLLRGDQEVARLHAETAALGRAVAEAEEQAHGPSMAMALALDHEARAALEQIARERDHNPHPTWHEHLATHRGHRHPFNAACDQDQAIDQAPAPEAALRPNLGEQQQNRAASEGRAGSARRADWVRRVRNEGKDPITAYLQEVDQDPPDNEWRPA